MMAEEIQERLGFGPELTGEVAAWLDGLPPLIDVRDIGKHMGGLVARADLVQDISRGLGPTGARQVGQRTLYPADELLLWVLRDYGIKFKTHQGMKGDRQALATDQLKDFAQDRPAREKHTRGHHGR